jgi:hypothetical protein
MEKDLEKVDYIEVSPNKYANIGLTAEETDFYENYPEDARKKMIRKIDFRLVPVLALLYLMVSSNEMTSCAKSNSPLRRGLLLIGPHRPSQHWQCKNRRHGGGFGHDWHTVQHRPVFVLHPLHSS